jgi:hypothetical protein
MKTPALWEGAREGFKVPMLGDKVPRGWRRTSRQPLFVDSSGFGAPDEPALTQEQFLDALTIGKAYGVIEAGQFQVYVAEYEKTERRKPEAPAARAIKAAFDRPADYDETCIFCENGEDHEH